MTGKLSTIKRSDGTTQAVYNGHPLYICVGDIVPVDKFYPIGYIPAGVRLTAYSGEAAGLPPAVLQEFIDAVSEGAAVAPIGAVYQIDQIVEAHTAMEEGRVAGKIVVLT